MARNSSPGPLTGVDRVIAAAARQNAKNGNGNGHGNGHGLADQILSDLRQLAMQQADVLGDIRSALADGNAIPVPGHLPLSPEALAHALEPFIREQATRTDAIVSSLGKQIEGLAERVVRHNSPVIRSGGGSPASSRIRNVAGQNVNPATVEKQDEIIAALGAASDKDLTKFDYESRTDGQPIYVGQAPQGTSDNTADWKIRKFDYDASGNATRVQTLTGKWSGRTTLGWMA